MTSAPLAISVRRSRSAAFAATFATASGPEPDRLTTVTSWPCEWSSSASWRPTCPAPTTTCLPMDISRLGGAVVSVLFRDRCFRLRAHVSRAALSFPSGALLGSPYECEGKREPYGARASTRRADPRDHRDGPRPAGDRRRGGAVAAGGRPGDGDGLFSDLSLFPQPRRSAHGIDHRRLQRDRRGRGGGRCHLRRGRPPGTLACGLPRGTRVGAGASARVCTALRLARTRVPGATGHGRPGNPGRAGIWADSPRRLSRGGIAAPGHLPAAPRFVRRGRRPDAGDDHAGPAR